MVGEGAPIWKSRRWPIDGIARGARWRLEEAEAGTWRNAREFLARGFEASRADVGRKDGDGAGCVHRLLAPDRREEGVPGLGDFGAESRGDGGAASGVERAVHAARSAACRRGRGASRT